MENVCASFVFLFPFVFLRYDVIQDRQTNGQTWCGLLNFPAAQRMRESTSMQLDSGGGLPRIWERCAENCGKARWGRCRRRRRGWGWRAVGDERCEELEWSIVPPAPGRWTADCTQTESCTGYTLCHQVQIHVHLGPVSSPSSTDRVVYGTKREPKSIARLSLEPPPLLTSSLKSVAEVCSNCGPMLALTDNWPSAFISSP